MKAIYAGSFDPPTLGHEDVIRRSAKVFDHLYVGIGHNQYKIPFIKKDDRFNLLTEICKDLKNVTVVLVEGLLVDYCKLHEIGIIVRGLRATLDFETELSMAHVNRKLGPNIDTMFLASETENSFVSSSMVREVYNHLGDISSFVSPTVLWFLTGRK
jgi:pantetheine-phosphate adenylyltransferase